MGLDIRIPLGMMSPILGACSRDSILQRSAIYQRSLGIDVTCGGAGAAGVGALMLCWTARRRRQDSLTCGRPCPGRVLLSPVRNPLETCEPSQKGLLGGLPRTGIRVTRCESRTRRRRGNHCNSARNHSGPLTPSSGSSMSPIETAADGRSACRSPDPSHQAPGRQLLTCSQERSSQPGLVGTARPGPDLSFGSQKRAPAHSDSASVSVRVGPSRTFACSR